MCVGVFVALNLGVRCGLGKNLDFMLYVNVIFSVII